MLIGKVKYLEEIEDNENQFLSSVKSSFIDGEIFEKALEDSKVLGTIEDRNKETPFFKQLSKDIFNTMYKIRPEIYDKKNVYNSLHVEHNLLTKLIDNEKFDTLRQNTCGDMFNSTYGLKVFQDEAYKIIQEWTKESEENQKLMDNINNALQQQNQLENLLNDVENGDGDENTDVSIKELLDNIINLNNKIAEPSAKVNKSLGKLSTKLNKAIARSEEEVKETNEALNSLGLNSGAGSEEGQGTSVTPLAQKKQLVEILKKNNLFKKICEELGRVKESVGKIGKKPSKYGQIVCDIGSGDNLKKILNSEKVKLLDNELENDFYKKYLDKNLLEYKTQGIEESKGPIVVCLDISGSMYGDREVWSKAVAIASLQLAIKQRRNYRCITFSTKVVDIIDAGAGSDMLERALAISNSNRGGGTEFEGALKKALESIEESKFKKADVLFITDGYPDNYLSSFFKDKFNRTKINKNFTVQSILIGDTNKEYLQEFSDSITTLSELNNKEALVGIFNKMKSAESNLIK